MRLNVGRMIGLGLTAYTMYKAYQKYNGGHAPAPGSAMPSRGSPSTGVERMRILQREAMQRRRGRGAL